MKAFEAKSVEAAQAAAAAQKRAQATTRKTQESVTKILATQVDETPDAARSFALTQARALSQTWNQ